MIAARNLALMLVDNQRQKRKLKRLAKSLRSLGIATQTLDIGANGTLSCVLERLYGYRQVWLIGIGRGGAEVRSLVESRQAHTPCRWRRLKIPCTIVFEDRKDESMCAQKLINGTKIIAISHADLDLHYAAVCRLVGGLVGGHHPIKTTFSKQLAAATQARSYLESC